MTLEERVRTLWDSCNHHPTSLCSDCVACAIREAVAAEREECAKEADFAAGLEEIELRYCPQADYRVYARGKAMASVIADAIRAHSEKAKGE